MRESGSRRGTAEQQRGAGSDAQDYSVTKRTLLTPLLPNGAFSLLHLEAGTAHAETQGEPLKPQTHTFAASDAGLAPRPCTAGAAASARPDAFHPKHLLSHSSLGSLATWPE